MSDEDKFDEVLRKLVQSVSEQTLFGKDSQGITELLVLGYFAKNTPRVLGLQLLFQGKKYNVIPIVKQLQQLYEEAKKDV